MAVMTMNKDIPFGTKVKLDPTSKWAYTGTDPSNPINEVGEVIPMPQSEIDRWGIGYGWIWVKWSHMSNCYPEDETCLIKVEE